MDEYLQRVFSHINVGDYWFVGSVIFFGTINAFRVLFSSDLQSHKDSLAITTFTLAVVGGCLLLAFKYIENPLSEGMYRVVYESQTNTPKERWIVVEGEKKELHLIKIKNDSLSPQTKEFIKAGPKFYPTTSPTEAARISSSQ